MDERDRQGLADMRGYARHAIAWAREAGAHWTDDAKTVAAVAHAIGQIGEAARRISLATKATHADVPWTAMAGMRNRIYHDYGRTDPAVLRETVRRELPALRKRLDAILGRRSARMSAEFRSER